MIMIKRLSKCTFEEATELWNQGFSGYAVNFTMSVNALISRFGLEGLDPTLSVAAFVDGEPAGIVISGSKHIDGKRVAWNGGTGVAPTFRGQGIGRVLMEAAMDVYREESVDIATLEVLVDNVSAVKLYQRMGYEICGHLFTLRREGAFEEIPVHMPASGTYHIRYGAPSDVKGLAFTNKQVPWSSMWQNLIDGQSLFVHDEDGEVVGYALFKRRIGDGSGRREMIGLFQCEVKPGHHAAEEIVRYALAHVFAPHEFDGLRTAGDYTVENELVVRVLQEMGFVVQQERYLMNTPQLATMK
jgi:ribosomal protein S18 acetylase RimI-like enzyme